MTGDRASGGTAAVTCGVRCHPQLFTPGSQVPQRPRGNRGTGEASQPGGRQGSLEPPLHSQRGRQSLSARPPGELRPSPRPEAGPSSAPASKGPPCGLQPPPGRQRSGALQVVAQPPAQIQKGWPSRADGDAPTCPHATRGQPSPAAAAAGPRQADARAAAWPGREAAALARTAFPWAPQATLPLLAAQPGPRCHVSRGSRSPASLTVLRRPHLWEPPQGTWDEPATAEALPAPGHSVPGSCCGPGRGSPGEAPGLSRARGALSASGEARGGRRRRQHRRREVLSRAHGPGDDQHWGQPRSPRSLQAPFKNASRQVWTQGGRKRAGPASGDARPPGPVHSLCESHDLGCVGSG